MKVNQIASILNTLNQTMVGTEDVFADDLSNIVDGGKTVLDYTDGANGANFDNYIKALIDQVGRVIFVDRAYTSHAPNILKDSWEYGSVLMKVRAELMDARDNTTWSLGDIPNGAGVNYDWEKGTDPKVEVIPSRLDPFILSKPNVTAKFFNKRVTYEVAITLVDYQLREAFRSAADMSRFIAMLENRIRVKRILCTDALIMATIRNLAGFKIATGKAINLLPLYNATLAAGTEITAADYWSNPDAIRFGNKTIALYKEYLTAASTLFNEGDYITYTPEDRLKAVFLAEYVKDAEAYLYSDTFNREFVELSGYEEIGFWQGTGEDGSLASRSSIRGKFVGNNEETVTGGIDGVVAMLFDDEAAVVCCEHDRVTSQYNGRGEYTNYFYKWDAGYLNDMEENCVVFYISDTTVSGALPATKPTDWDSAYAIASSPYKIWDPETEAHVALTADDASTETGFDWADYAGKAYTYTPST